MMTALCLAGCGSSRKTEAVRTEVLRVESDSLVRRTSETALVREAVSSDTALLAVAADSVLSLPEGAAFTARSGRASLDVRRGAGGVIVVRGTCDSLERAVSYWAGRAEHYRSALAARDTLASTRVERPEEVRGSPPGWFVKGMAAGVAAVCMVILIVKRKKE